MPWRAGTGQLIAGILAILLTHIAACPTVSEGQSNSSASFKPVLSMSYDNEGDASEGVQYQSTDGALPQAALLSFLHCCLLGLQTDPDKIAVLHR